MKLAFGIAAALALMTIVFAAKLPRRTVTVHQRLEVGADNGGCPTTRTAGLSTPTSLLDPTTARLRRDCQRPFAVVIYRRRAGG